MIASVIIPCFNESMYIGICIESLLNQKLGLNEIEILVVDGMSNDGTREIIDLYQQKNPRIQLIDNFNRTVPFALNLGILKAHGDVIVRIDAHCVYPDNYISSLVEALIQFKADNVGGVLETLPADNTDKSLAIASAVSHTFGVGNSYFRIGSNQIIETDTVPFGCFRKEVFEKYGLFDIDLVRNQDDEFNGRIRKNGGKIYLIPNVSIKYYSRSTFEKLCTMFYQYGLFKPLVNLKLGSPTSVRQLIPPLFVVGLVLGLCCSLLIKSFLVYYVLGIAFYLLISFGVSMSIFFTIKNLNVLLLLPFTFLVIHISYGFGYLKGLIKFNILRQKSHNAKISR